MEKSWSHTQTSVADSPLFRSLERPPESQSASLFWSSMILITCVTGAAMTSRSLEVNSEGDETSDLAFRRGDTSLAVVLFPRFLHHLISLDQIFLQRYGSEFLERITSAALGSQFQPHHRHPVSCCTTPEPLGHLLRPLSPPYMLPTVTAMLQSKPFTAERTRCVDTPFVDNMSHGDERIGTF